MTGYRYQQNSREQTGPISGSPAGQNFKSAMYGDNTLVPKRQQPLILSMPGALIRLMFNCKELISSFREWIMDSSRQIIERHSCYLYLSLYSSPNNSF